MRDLLDSTLGPTRFNPALAYGAASVPLIAAKYNLLFSDVYSHFKAVIKLHLAATSKVSQESIPTSTQADKQIVSLKKGRPLFFQTPYFLSDPLVRH